MSLNFGAIQGLVTSIVLRLIGGHPLSIALVTAQRFPLVKSLVGFASLGSVLPSIANGGIGAILKNPIAAITGNLQGAVGQALGAVSSLSDQGLGLGGITGALNTLNGALNDLSHVTDLMSGIAKVTEDGEFGLADVLSHASAIAGLGGVLPAGLGLDSVLAPLKLGSQLAGFASDLPGIVDRLTDGSLSPADALEIIARMAATVGNAMGVSRVALDAGRTIADAAGTVSLVASALQDAPADLTDVLRTIVRPDALAAMTAVAAAPAPDTTETGAAP